MNCKYCDEGIYQKTVVHKGETIKWWVHQSDGRVVCGIVGDLTADPPQIEAVEAATPAYEEKV